MEQMQFVQIRSKTGTIRSKTGTIIGD